MTTTRREYTRPLLTVIVFQGSPTSTALVEAYRRTWSADAAGEKAARRYARETVTRVRMRAATDERYTPPVASIFEDSPSRGLGEQVAEYASRARKRFLARVAATSSAATAEATS